MGTDLEKKELGEDGNSTGFLERWVCYASIQFYPIYNSSLVFLIGPASRLIQVSSAARAIKIGSTNAGVLKVWPLPS